MTNVSDNRESILGEATGLTPLPVLRIAIADDDPDSLELLHLALESPMTEIYEATNGVELVRLLVENDPFDLVVTDVLMPWMEGLQVLRSARVAEVMTPVLVISGLTRPDLRAMVDRLGNAALLPKPFGIGDLRAAISDLMSRQQLS
ncbi:MAG TPA: response regulator [Polyangia bacterium]